MRSTPLLVAGGVGVFVAAGAIAALVSDAASGDDEYVVPDAVAEYPVIGAASGGPTDATIDPADPGAVIAPVLVPAPPPLLPDPPPDPAFAPAVDLAAPAGGTSTTPAGDPVAPSTGATPSPDVASTEVTTTTATPATTTTEVPVPGNPGGGSAGGGSGWGDATVPSPGDGPADLHAIYRFRDRCADHLVGACPPGLGATVLFSNGNAPPPPLQLDLVVDPPVAVRSQIRCDLPWPTGSSIPVLITSNRPLDIAHSRLMLTDGRAVDEAVNVRSDPSEFTWYDQRVTAGQPVGTAVGDGVHTCVAFDLESNAAPPNVDRNGRFELNVTGFAGSSSETRTIQFDGNFRVGRPPVRVLPLDGYRAMVVVPQRRDDVVAVELYHSSQRFDGPDANGSCPASSTLPGSGADDGTITPRSPTTGPTAYSPADLDAPDYPFDRGHTHYTVWDLYLKEGNRYALCVEWQVDGSTEQIALATPHAWRFKLSGGSLRYRTTVPEGSLTLHVLGINGCFVANPGQGSPGGRDPLPERTLFHSSGWEYWHLPDPRLCDSAGWRVPDVVEVRTGRSEPGDNTVYGVLHIPIDVAVRDCRYDWSATGSSTPADSCSDITVEWRNQNVLCGGPWGSPACQGDLLNSLTMSVTMSGDGSQIGSDPRAWSITRDLRLADPGDTVPADQLQPQP